MPAETLCFAAAVALCAVAVWVCSKLKSGPLPMIAHESIPENTPVSLTGGEFGGVRYVHRCPPVRPPVPHLWRENHATPKEAAPDEA